jgi:hypothetical protein
LKNAIDFSTSHCFNFAYALCMELKTQAYIPVLVAILAEREESEELVCIHCLVEIYVPQQSGYVYLDAAGDHNEDYPEERLKEWEETERELTGLDREGEIREYTSNDIGFSGYWKDLQEYGAFQNDEAIAAAHQQIQNSELFKAFLA